MQIPRVGVWQGIHTQQLHAEVVVAASLERDSRQAASTVIEIVGLTERRPHGGLIEVFIHTVGRQQEDITCTQRQCPVVDLQRFLHAQRAAQIAFLAGYTQAVVFGELFQLTRLQAINARIAHMKQVGRSRFDHQRTKGADIAPVGIVAVFAAAGLRYQPGIAGGDHALGGGAYRPSFGGTEVVIKKALHGTRTGNLADRTGANAIGDGNGSALEAELGLGGNPRGAGVLIVGLASLIGILADTQLQSRRCGCHVCPGDTGRGGGTVHAEVVAVLAAGAAATLRLAPVRTCVV